MRIIPIQAFLAYRFDVAAQRWNVPLVPYAKAGVGAWFWSTEGMSGRRGGFSYGGGLQFLLDVIDSQLARETDRELGINNSYLYVDWAGWMVDGFGSDGIVLSDDGIVSFGLALDF